MSITVAETVPTGRRTVERTYTDEEILDMFPDGDGSLVNPLLRRAQKAEAEIERLNNLFGSRFHTDTQCGSCGGPLECDRDAICHRCTDEMKVWEKLTCA